MPAQLDNLPPLTPDQANVMAAMLGVEGRLIDAANFTGLPLARFLDLLESPEVQAHLRAADRGARHRARIRLADAAPSAVATLEDIAADADHDKTERRRAATTIIRALAPRLAPLPRRPKRLRPDPTTDLTTTIDLGSLIRTARELAPKTDEQDPPPPSESSADPPTDDRPPSQHNAQPSAPPSEAEPDKPISSNSPDHQSPPATTPPHIAGQRTGSTCATGPPPPAAPHLRIQP